MSKYGVCLNGFILSFPVSTSPSGLPKRHTTGSAYQPGTQPTSKSFYTADTLNCRPDSPLSSGDTAPQVPAMKTHTGIYQDLGYIPRHYEKQSTLYCLLFKHSICLSLSLSLSVAVSLPVFLPPFASVCVCLPDPASPSNAIQTEIF